MVCNVLCGVCGWGVQGERESAVCVCVCVCVCVRVRACVHALKQIEHTGLLCLSLYVSDSLSDRSHVGRRRIHQRHSRVCVSARIRSGLGSGAVRLRAQFSSR